MSLKATLPLVLLAACLNSAFALAQHYPSGEDVAREAMLRALAEKARNDAIVREQRRMEQQRRIQEERLRRFEEAERRARKD